MQNCKKIWYKITRYISVCYVRGGVCLFFYKVIWNIREVRWRLQKELILFNCFGDSHSTIFEYINQNCRPKNILFRVVSVQGGTVSGLNNPNSKTNAINIFNRWLKKTSKHQYNLFLLGEVDTSFLIWLKAQKQDICPRKIMIDCLQRYFDFLFSLNHPSKKNIVCSCPLPTIQDGASEGEILNLRKGIRASQLERTHLTLAFNRSLGEWCHKHDIKFINFDLVCLNSSTGLIHKKFRNSVSANHHYDEAEYAKVICNALTSMDKT